MREQLEQIRDDFDRIRSRLETERVRQLAITQSAVGFVKTIWNGPNPEWLNLADSGETFQLLAARDHFKTTVLTLDYALYRIVKDPNTQGLLVSESASQAHKWSRYLRTQIEHRFPWLSNRDQDKWTDRLFTVPRQRESKDSTIEAVGMLGRIVGGHFDWAIVDDVVSLENTRSLTMRDHVDDWLKQVLIPCMVPKSQIIVTGSAWHYDDEYARLEKEGWKTYRYRALKDDGQPLFPERYSLETLAKKQQEVGSPVFACQYMLDPSGLVGRLLKLEWLEPYYDVAPGDLEIVQGVDPAYRVKETADYTAIVTVGYSKTNKTCYVLDTFRAHLSFPEQLKIIRDLAEKWVPSRIIVEINAYQQTLYQALQNSMLPVLPRENLKDKVTRIMAVSPYFETKRVLVRREMHDWIGEYLQFPDAPHDDLLDATEMAVRDIVDRYMFETGIQAGGGGKRDNLDWTRN